MLAGRREEKTGEGSCRGIKTRTGASRGTKAATEAQFSYQTD